MSLQYDLEGPRGYSYNYYIQHSLFTDRGEVLQSPLVSVQKSLGGEGESIF
jgi:hypothetical protein